MDEKNCGDLFSSFMFSYRRYGLCCLALIKNNSLPLTDAETELDAAAIFQEHRVKTHTTT